MAKTTESKVITITDIKDATEQDMRKCSPGKFLTKKQISFPNPLNDGEIIIGEFMVSDGFALGKAKINNEVKEIAIEYPLTDFVNKTATLFKENIKKHLNITEERDVTVYEILRSYGQIKVLD